MDIMVVIKVGSFFLFYCYDKIAITADWQWKWKREKYIFVWDLYSRLKVHFKFVTCSASFGVVQTLMKNTAYAIHRYLNVIYGLFILNIYEWYWVVGNPNQYNRRKKSYLHKTQKQMVILISILFIMVLPCLM